MQTLRDLLALLAFLAGQIAKHALLLVPALVLIAVIGVRGACACSTKETAYATAMRSDLRNVAAYHESRRTKPDYYFDTLPTPYRFRWSSGVSLVYMRSTASGFIAELAYPERTENRCHLVHVWGTDPMPRCYWTRTEGRRAYPR